ncbi:N-acetylmuramoyl-L-alanine amidase [Rufibacter roseus]|uniref:N-acetylmuramoyl-L-alanine amidase n=1 Tax=Rufibacter roseus TaxID=1567108 RepID=A0ABW2DJP4_9BACT|nr:N-acetylmuramoyl-L-alanine amidase [Rufibacter roseus]
MTKHIPSLLTLLAFFGFTGAAYSQQGVVKSTTIAVQPANSYQVEANSAEAVGLKCESCVMEQAYFVVGQDTVKVTQDAHADMAALVFLPSKQKTVTFYSGTIKGDLSLNFMNGTPTKPIAKKGVTLRTGDGNCSFEVVPPSVWRAGLNQPSYTPGFSTTNVIAVHHGASANTAPTYEESLRVLRSYYTYHTTPKANGGNGWSDIGYNYLIGPDGTIFLGREKLSWQTRDSDEIIGAHLCAMNTNTMGICMIGDYSNQMPTAKALESLYKLIKWKAEKSNIDLDSRVLHPADPNRTQNNIPRLIGHREGPCSTTCPGELFYKNHFISPANHPDRPIRNEVGNVCEVPLGFTNEEMNQIVVVYPNPTNGSELKANFEYRTVAVHALDGKVIRPATKKSGESISTSDLAKGIYFLHFDTPDYGRVVRRVVIN